MATAEIERKRISPETWYRISAASVVLSVLVLPIVFVPLALFAGQKVKHTNEPLGWKLQGAALLSAVAWYVVFFHLL